MKLLQTDWEGNAGAYEGGTHQAETNLIRGLQQHHHLIESSSRITLRANRVPKLTAYRLQACHHSCSRKDLCERAAQC